MSDIVTDAMTAFGLQAQESAHFADVLAKASSSSNTNVAMMGETFWMSRPLPAAWAIALKTRLLPSALWRIRALKDHRQARPFGLC